jgi:hypothetical protein
MRHGFGRMDLVVIDDSIKSGMRLGRIAFIENGEQVSEQRRGLARPHVVEQHPGGQIECPGQVILLMLAWGYGSQSDP